MVGVHKLATVSRAVLFDCFFGDNFLPVQDPSTTNLGHIIQIVFKHFRQRQFVTIKLIEIPLGSSHRHVRFVEPQRQKERLIIFTIQFFDSPSRDFFIGHATDFDIQRGPCQGVLRVFAKAFCKLPTFGRYRPPAQSFGADLIPA